MIHNDEGFLFGIHPVLVDRVMRTVDCVFCPKDFILEHAKIDQSLIIDQLDSNLFCDLAMYVLVIRLTDFGMTANRLCEQARLNVLTHRTFLEEHLALAVDH